MSETIACLSVRQPWADLIVAGIKPFENRTWPCAHRGPLLIHAGKAWGLQEQNARHSLMEIAIKTNDLRRQHILMGVESRLGGLVGSCVMRSCIHEDKWFSGGGLAYDGVEQWFVGPYGYALTGAKYFHQIIPYRGQQGLFRVPRRTVSRV